MSRRRSTVQGPCRLFCTHISTFVSSFDFDLDLLFEATNRILAIMADLDDFFAKKDKKKKGKSGFSKANTDIISKGGNSIENI